MFVLRALGLSAGPHGRHWIPGESLRKSSARCRTKASAQDWISPGFRSAATLPEYLAEILCQIPDKSGLPSAVRGAGAARFGLPFALRGMPGVGYFSHCAASVVVSANKIITNTMGFIRHLPAAKGGNDTSTKRNYPQRGTKITKMLPFISLILCFLCLFVARFPMIRVWRI